MRPFALAVLLAAAMPAAAHLDLGFEPWEERTQPAAVPEQARLRARSAQQGDTVYYSNAVRVLGYHDVYVEPLVSATSDVLPDNFQDQMEFLQRAGYNVVSMQQVKDFITSNTPVPVNAVAITFDDDYRGQYWHAWPVLHGLNFHSTYYVHSQYVGVMTSKDHTTWDELRAMEATGLADVQSHTVTHANLASIGMTALDNELVNSRTKIQDEMSKVVTDICYPYGAYNATVIARAQAAGYSFGESTIAGFNIFGTGVWDIRRDLLGVGDTLKTFKNLMGYTGTDPDGPIIVDNSSPAPGTFAPGSFTTTGSTGTHRGQYGTNYTRATATTGSPSATATWTAPIGTAGSYEVFAWWPGAAGVLGSNTGATYNITQGALNVNVPRNQSAANKGRWVSLGNHNLTTGTVTVTLTNSVVSGTEVFADALKFAPDGPAAVADWNAYEAAAR